MQLFKLKTRLSRFDAFSEFASEFSLGEKDLIITHQFLFEPFMAELHLPCKFIMQEKYGVGEPTDTMMNQILADVKGSGFERVIAIGGGTVIDIAKLFVLKDLNNVVDAFERNIPIIKEKQLIIIPTTCGTGSEVTNVSIAEITSKQTKMGLADDEIIPDDAVLIPEFLKGLPFKFYACSAIDALIHATESYVSPKANIYTKLYSAQAICMIIEIFQEIAEKGEESRFERLEEMLVASNFAGIAFGNAGVGAVHALSYPLGGTYHVAHGEANYQFFTAVFKLYNQKKPNGSITELNELLCSILNTTNNPYDTIDALLGKLISKNQLRTYGMKEEEIQSFTTNVLEKQQRLLTNNYVPFTEEDIRGIFSDLY